jgi:hypothetical protein
LVRISSILALLSLVVFIVAPAQGSKSSSRACGSRAFSYAGLQSNEAAHGIRATIAPLSAPDVPDGHVGGWIGVGGVQAGPRGTAEWLQTGYASLAPENTVYIYYEVTVPGKAPAYHEVKSDVKPGEKHDFAVLEVGGRNSWWRVWVDGKPVTKAIHLPGSHTDWYPQAMAENWNGNAGSCNSYAYRFSNVRLAQQSGGVWQTLKDRSMFEDPGYQVVQTSRDPSNFVATSL